MPYSTRSDGKYNRQAQYFLCSVKDRNLPEFLSTLKREKRRHAEPKAAHITALGENQRHKQSPVDLDELFYFLNAYNEMEEGGTFYLRRLKKIIMEQIERDYEEMGKTVKDLSMSYLDKQDNFWDEVYKNGVDL